MGPTPTSMPRRRISSSTATAGVHRQFITILIQPKDGSPTWSMGFSTAEYTSALGGSQADYADRDGQDILLQTIGVTRSGVS